MCGGKLGNEIAHKKGVSKIRQMSGPFQNLIAGGTRSLERQRNQEKHLCQLGIGLLRQDHLPAKRCSRSQRCQARTAGLCHARTRDSGDKNAEQA